MNLLSFLAPYFERYLTLERVHLTKTYDYKARGLYRMPVIDVTMHKKKCGSDSWLYVAIPVGSDLASLDLEDKLYIGSQTADRMFRGNRMGGMNFHHAQMRAGNGDDNLITFLRSGRQVDIYRISAAAITKAVSEIPSLNRLKPLLHQPKKHVGYWFEQFVLHADSHGWRWNTAGAEGPAEAILKSL